MDRVLPEALQNGIGKVIEYAYSFEPMFAPTVVLGEYVSSTCQLGISGGTTELPLVHSSIAELGVVVTEETLYIPSTLSSLASAFLINT